MFVLGPVPGGIWQSADVLQQHPAGHREISRGAGAGETAGDQGSTQDGHTGQQGGPGQTMDTPVFV